MNITVDFYKKTESICPSCNRMDIVLKSWVKKHPEHEVEVNYLSAEEHLEKLMEMGVREAPAVLVCHGDNDEWTMVSGNNPDILVDLLDGEDGLWEL